MERQIKEFAKRTGYKEKKGMWFDKQGFPCSESEIIAYFREIQRVLINKMEREKEEFWMKHESSFLP